MSLKNFKDSLHALLESAGEGWQRLRRSAAGAMTAFRTGDDAGMPARTDVDDAGYLPTHAWSMLGGDLFEDERRLVVRLEVPGMAKEDFQIEVIDDLLVVRGEKRFTRESSDGRYRMLQCAYGSFRREVALPVPVAVGGATAAYERGVLRIELPKAEPGHPKLRTIPVR